MLTYIEEADVNIKTGSDKDSDVNWDKQTNQANLAN